MPSDIERVITWSKRFESHLERRYGATGRGLHEKVSSVEHKLSHSTVRDLRFVATIRNKLLHEAGYDRIDDRRVFSQRTRRAARTLGMTHAVRKFVVAALVLTAAFAAAATLLWLRLR